MIRAIEARDHPALLGLNNAHAIELSELSNTAFAALAKIAFKAACTDDTSAFLFAFDQNADYHSPHFRWFQARYDCFVYVDRVVVSQSARSRGLARLLYSDLFAAARAAAHVMIVCEINSNPPNLASDAFHAKLGFGMVGEATLPGSGKTVRYMSLAL